jgi:predicted dehydrogenase
MDKVNYAIVGCGSVSWNRYFKDGNWEAVEEAGGNLVAVCDTDEDRARRPAMKFDIPYYLDLDEMLERQDFDLLVNLTHVPAHFALSLKGLQAGRHVYTQKPMTVTVEEATTLIEEAARRGLKLVAEDAGPIQPVHRAMIDLVKQGVIGKVVWIRATCTHWGPAIIDNWPTDPSWFYQKGAGPLRDVGIERLHMLTALLGPAQRVSAMSGVNQPEVIVRGGPNKGKKITVTEDDITLLTMDFGNGIYAMLDNAWVNVRASFTPQMEIYGQKGVISHLSGGGNKGEAYNFDLQLYRDEPELGIRGWTGVNVIPPVKRDPPPSVVGLIHAVECILENKKPVLSGEHARHCIEIIEKGFLAARTGVTQKLETSF